MLQQLLQHLDSPEAKCWISCSNIRLFYLLKSTTDQRLALTCQESVLSSGFIFRLLIQQPQFAFDAATTTIVTTTECRPSVVVVAWRTATVVSWKLLLLYYRYYYYYYCNYWWTTVSLSTPGPLSTAVNWPASVPVSWRPGRDGYETLQPETETRPRRDVCRSRDVTDTLK